MKVRALFALVAVVSATAIVRAETYKAAETFDYVFRVVRDTSFDPAFDRAKWEQAGSELRPKALAAATPGEFRAVLRDLLGRLGLSHMGIISATPDGPDERRSGGADAGIDVRLIDRQVVVSSVAPGSGAAAAGVKPGWTIDAIDGTPMTKLIAEIAEGTPSRVAQLEAWRLVETRLRGGYGTTADVAFVDGAGATVKKTIERRGEKGEPQTVGSLPTMFVRVNAEPKQTPAGHTAGVIAFNVWMTAVDAPFQKAVDEFRSSDGIVIDLRGNPGGLAAMIMGIAGHFVGDRATLGTMKTNLPQPLHFSVNPRLVNAAGERVEPYKGPVAILVDGMTGSASECFAGGMQSLGRARVFGETSMGAALPALFDRLPNGDVFIHAYGDFVTGTGVRIEGRGVVPDEPAALTRAALLQGHDPALEAALAWIDRAQGTKADTRKAR